MSPRPSNSSSAAEQAGTAAAEQPVGLACSVNGICWFRVLVFLAVIALFVLGAMLRAPAADAGSGRQLAQEHCAACHAIAPHARSEVADAPPFETIGRQYGFDAGRIAHAIAGSHPKMNFSPRPAQAADVAAYIASLGR
jgi:mono/diheme cytochrome c family protein